MDSAEERPAGSLDRGLTILSFLAGKPEAAVNDIAKGVALSRSTTYRLVDQLAAAGWLTRTGTAGHWRLGPAAARLGAAAGGARDVAQVAPDLLRVLVQQTRETVGLGVPGADEMVFIYREQGPNAVTVSAPLGARRPLHCTSVGKAYLAALPPEEASRIVRRLDLVAFTASTLTTVEALEADLDAIRARGWSQDEREFEASVACCGAAVLDHQGRPVGAISASGPHKRMLPALGRVGPVVVSTAEAISRRLGHLPEDDLA